MEGSVRCVNGILCIAMERRGLTTHHLPLSASPVCMRVASWELRAIHHVCLCSRALWHACLPSSVSTVGPVGVLLCQGQGMLHPSPPPPPPPSLRFCQWRASSHGNPCFQGFVQYSKVMTDLTTWVPYSKLQGWRTVRRYFFEVGVLCAIRLMQLEAKCPKCYFWPIFLRPCNSLGLHSCKPSYCELISLRVWLF